MYLKSKLKKLIPILLLSVYLISFQEFRQVFKLPVLIEHFVNHQLINKDYTLMGFFEHHYLDKNLDNDYEQDKKLPFRTYDFSTVSSPLVFTFQGIEDFIPKKPKIVIFEKKAHYFYKKDFISEFHYSIFQPPEFLM